MWAYGFVQIRTRNGRAMRLLTVIDKYTRKCLAIRVGHGKSGPCRTSTSGSPRIRTNNEDRLSSTSLSPSSETQVKNRAGSWLNSRPFCVIGAGAATRGGAWDPSDPATSRPLG